VKKQSTGFFKDEPSTIVTGPKMSSFMMLCQIAESQSVKKDSTVEFCVEEKLKCSFDLGFLKSVIEINRDSARKTVLNSERQETKLDLTKDISLQFKRIQICQVQKLGKYTVPVILTKRLWTDYEEISNISDFFQQTIEVEQTTQKVSKLLRIQGYSIYYC